MATTTNYGWTTPDDTALVKDGAAAIRSLGTSIDTTTKNLNPSTTLGDIEYRSSTANVNTRLPLGTAGQVLKVNSGATAPEWATDASGMTNPMTTTGDTIYSSSGSTPARLGIGTTGQVLTVAGGVPTWATPAGGSFIGCRIYNYSGQSISNASNVVLTYSGEDYDTDSLHSTTTNTSRMTVPAGQGGYYLITGYAQWTNDGSGRRILKLHKNGSGFGGNDSQGFVVSNTIYPTNLITTVENLSAGDYIEMVVYQTSGSTIDVINSVVQMAKL
jgi:hypothetical protein